ncbi:MAG: molybdopterin-binding protein [Paracoccaceae bacterium]
MNFGAVSLSEVMGGILAHSEPIVGGSLRKGTVLGPEDVAALAAAGHTQVVIARLSDSDLHEDDAAARVAAALVPDPVGQGLRLTPASTGRVNIHATGAGVMVLNVASIHALNRVNPMITLATVPPFQRIDAGGMIATVKIIAYGVPRADVSLACMAAPRALHLAVPRFSRATLIETTITAKPPAIKGREALAGRLARLGLTLTERVVVPHEDDALAVAIVAAPGEVVFVATASATSDTLDTAPNALRLAGGSVTQFGLPVDPGNLLFFGHLGAKPVIGLPGCARSMALNGADWVLERLICGVPLTPEDIAQMGVGGLLKEIPSRPRPREA